jgi:hypothetical protein
MGQSGRRLRRVYRRNPRASKSETTALERAAPSDPLVSFALAVAAIADRGIAWADAEDRAMAADNVLYLRAQKHFVDEPKMAMSSAWGGNNAPTPSGRGTTRRIFDPRAFSARLKEIARQRKAAAA